MDKKTRKAIKELTGAIEDLREQNEELYRKLAGALESQSEQIRVLAQALESRPYVKDENFPEDVEEPEVTEAAERKAEELGVDLSELEGTGAEGRILVKDVEEAAEAGD